MIHFRVVLRAARAPLFVVSIAAGAAGCRPAADAGASPADAPPVVIAPENIAVVEERDLQSGPAVSGALEPARMATLRAEIGGAIREAPVEAGQAVRAGALLLRLDDTALREAARSAESGVILGREQAEQARRNLERAERLAAAGAVAEQAVEQARAARLGAEATLADLEARLTAARSQLAKAEVRAPFAGVVSARPVHQGDVVQPGLPLVTVVDPASMRLEAAVPLEALDSIRPGARVEFTVPGYAGRIFAGTVQRTSPTVDQATRQLPVTVTIPNVGGALVAGLFAEGRVSVRQARGLAVPYSALDLRAGAPRLAVLRGGRIVSLPAVIGLRDDVLELALITEGLAAGDTVLVGAARAFTPGLAARVGADR